MTTKQAMLELATAIKAIEAWQNNRQTTFTPSNILADFGETILAALRSAQQAEAGAPVWEDHDMGRAYAEAAAPVVGAGVRQGMAAAMKIVDDMRVSEAGLFDAKHSGQRGCDRSDALYDAYHAIRKALSETVTDTGGGGEGKRTPLDISPNELNSLATDAFREAALRTPQAAREVAADAIRTFCQSLGAHAVVVSSDGVERIYHAGISLDALSVAVALALSKTSSLPSTDRGGQ